MYFQNLSHQHQEQLVLQHMAAMYRITPQPQEQVAPAPQQTQQMTTQQQVHAQQQAQADQAAKEAERQRELEEMRRQEVVAEIWSIFKMKLVEINEFR